mgnify:CR=1 FL=1
MDHFEEQVASFQQQIARWKELEQAFPQMREKLEELQSEIPERKPIIAQAKFDLDKVENPGFFSRLLGKQEELMAKARTAYREAAAGLDNCQRAISALENRISEQTQELEQLAGSETAYRQFLEAHRDDLPEAGRLFYLSTYCPARYSSA